jgi:hypothetical protein
MLFDTAGAAAYTIGQQPGDALDFTAAGTLTVTSTVTTAQTINATVLTHGGPGPLDGGLLATNSISNGGETAGHGFVGLTLGPVNIGGGVFIVSNGAAHVTTQLNGNITDTLGQPGSLWLRASTPGAANNSHFIINGNNTYTGGTTIEANTGTNGAVNIGSDSAFGTGKITTLSSANNPEIRALNGTRTISNAIDLNQGLNFAGTNSIVLNGPIAIASSGVNNSRTITNKITGGTLSLGASPGSSVIHLGNPVSNGGDGVGRTLILSAPPGSTMHINSLFQDVDANSAVQYGGNAGGTIMIKSLQTYTGRTLLGGGSSTIRFEHDYNVGDPSGPFGLGTLVPNNAANNALTPFGGDRTIANAIEMNTGFTVDDFTGDTSSVTFSGPITFTSTASRLIQNLMPASGGTLTLGSPASPSTLTLATTAGLTLTFAGSGKTVINDTIQDSPGVPMNVTVSNTSTTTFNGPQNTNGNFTISGNNSSVTINGARSGAGTVSLTGNNTKLFVNGSKTGGGAVTINSTGTLGGNGSIDGAVTNNGKIAPGTSIGTLTMPGNVTMGANSHLAIELSGTSADKIVVGGDLNLSDVDFLDVTGIGSGASWVIATYDGARTGTFDNVTPGYIVDYGTGFNSQITLLAGDWNGDGQVDAADYVAWRKSPANFGGDPDGYGAWRQNFGIPSTGEGGSGSDGFVPEPASMLLVLSAIVMWQPGQGRRRISS